MRVVRLIARLNIGGPARQVVLLDTELRARGCETLLVYGAPDPAEGSLDDLVIERGLPAVRLPRLGRRISVIRDAATALAVLRILFRERPDVVHTHTAKAGAVGRAMAAIYNATRARSRRAAVVHTFHGHVFTGYFGSTGSRVAQALERGLTHVTDRIITLSGQQRDDIVERFAIAPATGVEVIGAGHDLSRLLALETSTGALRERLGWSADHVVIGYVGRLVAIKDLPTLLTAFAIVAADTPSVRLLIAGDGDQQAVLERRAADLGIAGRVRFTGWIKDLPYLYSAIDIVALSSRNEGMPASLIEGMAAGRPVVATAVGGVPELVEQGKTGVLVAPGDHESLARALRSLVADAPQRRAFGAAGRAAVTERFAPDRFAAETLRVYRTAIACRRGHKTT